MLPPTSSSAFAAPGLLGSTSMDFDMASPSQSGYVGPQSLPNQGGLGGFSPPPSQQQPGISSGSPSSLHYSTSAQISVPTKRKTNKGADAAGSNRRSVSGQNDSSKISTPIQQLSKLSLNNGPTSSKKNKRDDDDSSVSSPPPMTPRSREHREARDERDPSVSDGSVSDTSNANPTSASSTGASGPATAKRKPYKELLTEEEKRANHIASEQKRRNTIRNGFKDMTDIIPDLRDVNSSKSTILFKAVDFIKQLEKRNRVLQEKANQLESRLINQGKVGAGPGVGANGISGMSGSALDDQRLQDIPHIYPVPCSR
ncbi:hypothetical protein BGW38_000751 [Lunasporangiospora selenospora]|uniref:BHLH domain-containing protein n=1 Tax=Lunasporangiospora selenospora TaxID=979761 RepID=A0A9P6KER3_9FUNG|nr:hypothetical protein BGW38_000751 [Lunasporangiospora selenospora]